MRTQGGQLPIDDCLLIANLGLWTLVVLVLLEFSDHPPEPNVDEVILRHSHDESECFEVKNDVEGPPLIFEDSDAFVEELVEFEDGVFVVVHVLDEAFDECADFFPCRNGPLIHTIYIL